MCSNANHVPSADQAGALSTPPPGGPLIVTTAPASSRTKSRDRETKARSPWPRQAAASTASGPGAGGFGEAPRGPLTAPRRHERGTGGVRAVTRERSGAVGHEEHDQDEDHDTDEAKDKGTRSTRLEAQSQPALSHRADRSERPVSPRHRRRQRTTVTAMPDYDAIVVGAGHNGLTAAAVMARAGLRVLCLEKNHFIGGMASTTELIRGYRFELAGSIQFPIPNEIFDDLGFASCPIYEPEVQSASIGAVRRAPILLYSDPHPPARPSRRAPRPRGRDGHGRDRGVGRSAGPGHRPLRRPQAPEVTRRDVGLRLQRSRA